MELHWFDFDFNKQNYQVTSPFQWIVLVVAKGIGWTWCLLMCTGPYQIPGGRRLPGETCLPPGSKDHASSSIIQTSLILSVFCRRVLVTHHDTVPALLPLTGSDCWQQLLNLLHFGQNSSPSTLRFFWCDLFLRTFHGYNTLLEPVCFAALIIHLCIM